MRKRMGNSLYVKTFPYATIFLLLGIVLSLFLIVSGKGTVKAFAAGEPEEEERVDIERYSSNGILLTVENRRFALEEDIRISVIVDTEYRVRELVYEKQGFDNVRFNDRDILNLHEFSLQAGGPYHGETVSLAFRFECEDGAILENKLVGIADGAGVFFGKDERDAKLRMETYRSLHGEEIVPSGLIDYKNARGDKTTYANCTVHWRDDYYVMHPLQGAKVELRDSDALGVSELLATAYSNNNGYCTFTFQNQTSIFENGCDLFVEVYAENKTVNGAGRVRTSSTTNGNAYHTGTSKTAHQNVSTGSNTTINMTYPDITPTIRQAYQVYQAAYWAYRFAKAMRGSEMPNVTIAYPWDENSKDETYYSYNNGIRT